MKCVVPEKFDPITGEKIDLTPRKAHPEDAGFDLFAPEAFKLEGGQFANIDTGVKVQIPEGYAGLIMNKSGLNFRANVESVTGVIDAGYTGTINVKLKNLGGKDKEFAAGDKISQLLVVKLHQDNKMEVVDELPNTARGNGGFGSTGR